MPERIIPLAQLVMLGCDAMIIIQVERARRPSEDNKGISINIGAVFLASAALLSFMAFCASFDPINYRWNLFLTSVSVGDLIWDSIAMSLALIAGVYLLRHVDSATVALFAMSTTVLVHMEKQVLDGLLIEAWSNSWGLLTGLVVFIGAGALFRRPRTSFMAPCPTKEGPSWKSKAGGYTLLVFLLVFVQTIFLNSGNLRKSSISEAITRSQLQSEAWIAGAHKSKTLDEAVREYSRRYRMPPPPDFDKWYEYAVSVDSPIIDDFTQIHNDLLPYWGISPQLLRQRTTHLLTHPKSSFGGIIIEGGSIQISPHIQGTHRWMMEVMQTMIEPFAQWLPDMQLAFNLDDECRVSIPYAQSTTLKSEGLKSQNRLASQVELHGFSSSQHPPWERDYLAIQDEDELEALWERDSPWFENWSKSPIFYEYISSTCPSDALVNKMHWWNRKAICVRCSAPHMADGVVSNWSLSGDLCHQPDLAYLHGFLISPAAMAATHSLFPVFSQSRMHNFADILYPNPWNFGDKVQYDDEKGIPWSQKLNGLYWRGASSDGFAAHGAWQSFTRARFVHLAQRLNAFFSTSVLDFPHASGAGFQSSSDNDAPIAPNVSFVGQFERCDERDCAAEHTTFYRNAYSDPAPSVDFQEHWKFRHLVDLDGAAFSGRFIPFLKSASLPYRAALFRTWWEERVHPWRHFVPVDVRLNELWNVVAYLSGGGKKHAEVIAREGGEWAKKALRKEDMRVYMFRLLLEWGRLIDDNREGLGFVAQS
ncbi:hypothetical protein PFICI_02096 [Pestalotiopsis fici W106-1]|uniref:Glycosyl transferase CAP10 domain-containing protein n=1 Tax=Pestalotiopsis fici (strain W106-1 / CGMCC3.15140) TaxID=1229662 RepID=W3XQF7_PESFW|nr:uncharacterized protein PFICI_02096 [Pestalotiopsis fici W106-1]ETS88268.1 hypothetical protein PFICI_02096 [Pestalotiopsis fici W106-1]